MTQQNTTEQDGIQLGGKEEAAKGVVFGSPLSSGEEGRGTIRRHVSVDVDDTFEDFNQGSDAKVGDGKSFTERLASFREGCTKLFNMGTEICALLKEHIPEANFCLTGVNGTVLDNSIPSDLVRISVLDTEGTPYYPANTIGLCVTQGRLVVCETYNGAPSDEHCDVRSAQQVLDDFLTEDSIGLIYNVVLGANLRRERWTRSRNMC